MSFVLVSLFYVSSIDIEIKGYVIDLGKSANDVPDFRGVIIKSLSHVSLRSIAINARKSISVSISLRLYSNLRAPAGQSEVGEGVRHGS